MKLVKLDKRHRALGSHGHTHGLRFECWNRLANAIELWLSEHYGSTFPRSGGKWATVYGRHRSKKTGLHPYWITVSNPAIASAVLLKFSQVKELVDGR